MRKYWPLLNEIAAGDAPASQLWESAQGIGQEVSKPKHYPDVSEVQRKAREN